MIDCVSLETGRVLFRVPLPIELDSPNLRIVPSGASVVVYAHDRPIESALLVVPSLGRAIPLAAAWKADDRRGTFEPSCEPPLMAPPGVAAGARLSLGGDPGRRFGRVAPFPGGRFLLVSADSHVEVAVIGSLVSPDASPGRAPVLTPPDWPRLVQGVAWDETGVTLVARGRPLRVTPDGCADSGEGALTHVRRGANLAVNGVVATGEVALSLAMGEVRGCLIAPFGALALLFFPGETPFLMTVAPLWSPFVKEIFH